MSEHQEETQQPVPDQDTPEAPPPTETEAPSATAAPSAEDEVVAEASNGESSATDTGLTVEAPAVAEAHAGMSATAIAMMELEKEAAALGISPELLRDPYGEEELDVSREDFEALLSQHQDTIGEFREGEIVEATVLRVTDSSVILEFGGKSEGSVALDEFKEPDTIEAGQQVEVLLENLENDDGVVVLSKKKADFLRVWEKIKEAYETDKPVKGTLVRKIKGGVTVDLMGVDAFLPGSQIALRRVPNIEDLIGDVYKFKIIKLNKRRRNIVVSRRVILEAEREKKRETLVKELLVGQVREGVVKNITDFGAFIDLGGLDGLLHITDMSWGRVGHPSEVVNIADTLDVKVLDIDWDRERISLGYKQLLPYPWTDIDKKYPVGSRVRGKVVSITNYGAFVELQKGVEGLVHISEMSWTRNVRHPSKLVSIGDEIEAVVLKVDPDDEKISLGMKQIEEDPWLALPVKYPTGTTLDGTVRNLTSFGAFVEIEPGIDGLVHVSDMSWTKRVEHPSEVVQKGEDVKVMVLDVDAENKRISLGIKQLLDDPWPGISERFAPGVESSGSVVRVQDKGLVVDLGDDIEGFVPGSHSGVEDASRLEEYYESGDPIELRVIESDASNRRIVLEATEVPARKPPKPQVEDDATDDDDDAGSVDAAGEAVLEAAVAVAAADESTEDAPEAAAAEPEAAAEADADLEAEGPVEVEAEAGADTDAEAPVEAEAGADTEAPVEAEAGADAEAPVEAEAGADTEPADAEAEVEALEAEAQTADAEAEVEALEAEAQTADAEAETKEVAAEADVPDEEPVEAATPADDDTKS